MKTKRNVLWFIKSPQRALKSWWPMEETVKCVWNAHPHLEKVVPCPPVSESPSPHSATERGQRAEMVRTAQNIRKKTKRTRPWNPSKRTMYKLIIEFPVALQKDQHLKKKKTASSPLLSKSMPSQFVPLMHLKKAPTRTKFGMNQQMHIVNMHTCK